MPQSLTPLIFNLGPTELIIILVIVLLLFGGSRLAGLGKSSGRALKEFKEETKGLREGDKSAAAPTATDGTPTTAPVSQPQVNGQVGPTTPYPPVPPTNLADPSAPDARRDA
jgi:sec-independent protein translocase protein TatA